MQAHLDRLRVLIVDDNPHMITIVKSILHGFGVRHIVDARDAAEAFLRLREGPVDIAIVDYELGVLDGVEFLKLVRSGKDVLNAFLPIIMLTSHSERSHVIAARDAGVTEFCAKPISAKDLWAKLAECVSNPRQFVRATGFFGPDRRRRNDGMAAPERRGQEGAAEGGTDSQTGSGAETGGEDRSAQ
jgi:CheY-like chemotaxis protein